MTYQVNFDRVVELVRAQGVRAEIEHTGGGVWAIYAGPTRHEEGWGDRSAAIAGPGARSVDGQIHGEPTDFYVGPENDFATDVVAVAHLGVTRDEQVAELIVAQARQVDPTAALSSAQLIQLGLDSAGLVP